MPPIAQTDQSATGKLGQASNAGTGADTRAAAEPKTRLASRLVGCHWHRIKPRVSSANLLVSLYIKRNCSRARYYVTSLTLADYGGGGGGCLHSFASKVRNLPPAWRRRDGATNKRSVRNARTGRQTDGRLSLLLARHFWLDGSCVRASCVSQHVYSCARRRRRRRKLQSPLGALR